MYVVDGDQFNVERIEGQRTERLLIDYAFGSGHHAMTFVSLIEPDSGRLKALEHRLTYFTDKDSLGITPGQKMGCIHGDRPSGYELTPRETLKCFGCHSTRTSAEGDGTLDVATMIPNVSCERCHGPARDHVEAARRGLTGPPMLFGLDQWTTGQMMKLCGQCHRDPDKAPPGLIRPENPHLARFQPVGLAQSRCYKESNGALSCVTCHDPHARTKSDHAATEAACLKCHDDAPRTVCSVSPRSGCVGCHMPGVDSGQDILFTDHWIRVRDQADARSSAVQPAP